MNWLSTYLSYTADQESPDLFHLWCGLSILASTLGRSVFIRKTYDVDAKVFPNLYVVLVSPSGRCRKGGALGFAYRILREAGVPLYTEAITKRALTMKLSNQIQIVNKQPVGESRVVICSEELEVFLGKEAILTGLFALLTRLYDCPDKWEYETASQGADYLYNTCVNIIGGTVPSWFTLLPVALTETGFLARVMIVAQNYTPRKNSGVRFNLKRNESMKKMKVELVSFLTTLREVKKELVLSPPAVEFYDEWYNEREGVEDERLASFNEREHDHVLKVAMLLAASYGDLFSSNVISSERVKEAIMILERLKGYMPMAYSSMGDSLVAKGCDRFKEQIRAAGGEISHEALIKKNYYQGYDRESFKRVIELLEDMGSLTRSITKGGKVRYKLVKEKKSGVG